MGCIGAGNRRVDLGLMDLPDEERAAEETMAEAIEGINIGALGAARTLLNNIIAPYPDWAEAWNKRATLSFIEKQDAECLADIEPALTIEPRHFGAIVGFVKSVFGMAI